MVDKGNYRHYMAKESTNSPSGRAHAGALSRSRQPAPRGCRSTSLSTQRRCRASPFRPAGPPFTPGSSRAIGWSARAAFGGNRHRLEVRYREAPLPEGGLMLSCRNRAKPRTLGGAALRQGPWPACSLPSSMSRPRPSRARATRCATRRAGDRVASTKAFTCQLAASPVSRWRSAARGGVLTEEREKELVAELIATAGSDGAGLKGPRRGSSPSRAMSRELRVYCISGAAPPIRSRWWGALKLKELSYIHAEGYAAGELKHGPRSPDRFRHAGGSCWRRMTQAWRTVSNLQEVARAAAI